MTRPLMEAEKLDALQELVNMGMGAAGAALAQALGTFVELVVPAVDFTNRRNVATLLDTGAWAKQEVEAIRQPFFGAFAGESMMIFDEQVHAELADLPGYLIASGHKATTAEQQEMLLDVRHQIVVRIEGPAVQPG